jgi:hypothetical protein
MESNDCGLWIWGERVWKLEVRGEGMSRLRLDDIVRTVTSPSRNREGDGREAERQREDVRGGEGDSVRVRRRGRKRDDGKIERARTGGGEGGRRGGRWGSNPRLRRVVGHSERCVCGRAGGRGQAMP